VLFAPPRPGRVRPVRARPARRRRVALARTAVLLLVVCAACWACFPTADARGRRLGAGPSADAYPLAGERGPALDDWGFVARQCTSYAAWFLNTHGVPFGLLTRGPAGQALFTSAGGWGRAATAAGFAVRDVPAVGSIAQWDPGESSPPAPPAVDGGGSGDGSGGSHGRAVVTAGRYGHVAVVRHVFADGSVVVSEFNGADGAFHVQVTRAPRYLYIGVPGSPAQRATLLSR
jgi:surface antigen